MITNTSLTLYNTYYDTVAKINKWQRKAIPAVMWENRKATNVLATGGQAAADQARIFIPRQAGYVGPASWKALAVKTGSWTLQEGDLIVKGTVTDALSSAFTPSQLKAKYNDVLMITSVDDNDMGSASMQHWQIGAK